MFKTIKNSVAYWKLGAELHNTHILQSLPAINSDNYQFLKYLPTYVEYARRNAYNNIFPFDVQTYLGLCDANIGLFPRKWECWWNFKVCIGASMSYGEPTVFTAACNAVRARLRPVSSVVETSRDRIPSVEIFHNCIGTKNAYGEKKHSLKHLVSTDFKLSIMRPVGEKDMCICYDIYHWLDQQTINIWYFDRWIGDYKLFFADKKDAMKFKLQWSSIISPLKYIAVDHFQRHLFL
jgi:hypothetical protein